MVTTPATRASAAAAMYAGTNNLLRDVPRNKIRAFEENLYLALDARHKDILENFRNGKLDNADLDKLKSLAAEISNQVK